MSYQNDESELELLTQREIEVIELVSDGLSNQDIADTLAIALHTVKTHLKHIFAKLDASSRTQAVARAREYGLVYAEPQNRTQSVHTMHNLPRSLIPLIGRRRELADLAAYLSDVDRRLITVHGPGGVGKTHLAIETAWQHLAAFPDGVFMVALESLDSSLFLLSAIAEALSFQFANQGDRKDQLWAYLGDKHMLLVMDGFEHLLDNTALVAELLAAAPELKVMVTSRERLNIHGETLYSLQGVAYPAEDQPLDTPESDAVTLFSYCIERVLPGFRPDAQDQAQIAEICRFVEGLPLGILLAASWVNALSIQDILIEIQQQAHVLETNALSTLFQYKGLEYVFQRSWNMLDPDLQAVFTRLTIFHGRFTRDAAQQVAGASRRMLSALVSKALLEWDPLHKRYRIHRLFRQYGLHQLQALGWEEEVKTAHFDFFTEFAQTHRDEFKQDPVIRQAWDNAIADLRAALQWANHTQHVDQRIELCLAMEAYWHWHGYFQEFFGYLAQALDMIVEPASARHAHAYQRAGDIAWKLGKPAASRDYTRRSIQIWHNLDKPDETCRALMVMGDNEHVAGNYDEATANYAEVLAIARENQHKTFMTMGLHGLGLVADTQQQFQQALAYYRESLEYARQVGEQRLVSVVLCNIGMIMLHQGDLDEAARLYTESLAIARQQNDLILIATNLVNLTEIVYMQHDYARARQLCLEGLELAHQIGFKMAMAPQLELLANIENVEGNPAAGARLYGATEALREGIDFPVPPREMENYLVSINAIRANMTQEAFSVAWEAGCVADLETVVAELITP